MEDLLKNISLKVIFIVIAVGIWVIVLQNAGLIPTSQNVNVVNTVGTRVYGEVDADVTGYVDVNLEAINGKSNAFYDFDGNGNYIRIPIYTGN